MPHQTLIPWGRKLTLLATAFALIALIYAASLAMPPLQAQEVTTLVSNATETSSGSENGTHAQSFQTGTNPTGYTITEVLIHLGPHQLTTNVAIAKIHENNSGEPGNDIATLTNSTTLLADSLNTFTAPAGTTLEPSTTYWVVVNDGVQNSTTWRLALTLANGETGETSWDIGNNRLGRASGTTWNTSTESLIIAIKGQINYPNLSIAPASATEGDDIVFTVNLSETSADDVTFNYTTSRESDDNSEITDFTADRRHRDHHGRNHVHHLHGPHPRRRPQRHEQQVRGRRDLHRHHQQPHSRRNIPGHRRGNHPRR